MKYILTIIFVLSIQLASAQVRGIITDSKGKPISFVTVVLEDTQQGVLSNEKGEYTLSTKGINKDIATIVYQLIGYQTKRENVNIKSGVEEKNVVLVEESIALSDIEIQVVNDSGEALIRRAIQSKKTNTSQVSAFEVDFYSKGMIKSLKIPKVLLNKLEEGEVKNQGIDSVGKGILYLSETVSKVKYQKPNKLREHIVASKVSGSNNGYSFNTADESFYDFYDNIVEVGDVKTKMISPIADQALSYYTYKIEAIFTDNGKKINKVKVIPKVRTKPVFTGYIYIEEERAALYGLDLEATGTSLQQPFYETVSISQTFVYDEKVRQWIKKSQNIELMFNVLGVKGKGAFLSVFNNYNFNPQFTQSTFGKELLSFAKDVNKKPDDYWEDNRYFSLTTEEMNDYRVKDSILKIKESPVYIDSIRRKYNTFHWEDIALGYTYKSKEDKVTFNYGGILDLNKIGFNTVQGFYMGTNISLSFHNREKKSLTKLSSSFNYGTASERFRAYGGVEHYFGDDRRTSIYAYGGTQISQFHKQNIEEYLNTAFSLLMRKNYAKYYNNENAYVGVRSSFFDRSLRFNTLIGYEQRKPLYNNANGSFYTGNRNYTSNNPLALTDYHNAAISDHSIFKFKLNANIYLGQKYITYPETRYYVPNRKYPLINIAYEKGFGGSERKYNYDYVQLKVKQNVELSNKGEFAYTIRGGHYFGGEHISFVDRVHFTGNESHLNLSSNYLSSFNLLPYYRLSTNKSFVETHLQYDFKGFLMNKVPLLRLTGWNTVLGYHHASVSDNKPYQEFTVGFSNVGFGQFKFFRIDYVRSYNGTSFIKDGVMIGIKTDF
ncbi:DUF5686 family protein [Myroides pelagicus]|uniref:Carboxypeptidase-like regulatory domain-containing protein n=1 Tax=Myroides pelagicus TaxID=270914 RepID=A0A7K1GKQ1_9FLAO|nr:DUF5686 family protein [Myroides pelagicus]MEC4113229.1 DUF5686 family protein [Myroides pelagicus]MTH29396.1 carboxypeptidase-like regulatory domain-containing protein [Myroides pelagicus]